MRKIFVFVLINVASFSPVYCGINDVSTYLMEKSVSMMDVGILRLDVRLSSKSVKERINFSQAWASYEPDKNLINITIFRKTQNLKFETCKQLIEDTRSYFITNIPIANNETKKLYIIKEFFKHNGKYLSNISNDYGKKLSEIVSITGVIVHDKITSICTGKLTEKSIHPKTAID